MSSVREIPPRGSGVNPDVYPELDDRPEPGEYQCPECRSRVTVGPTGREYGHRPTHFKDGPCPRRPREFLTEHGRRLLGLGGDR